MKKNIFVFLLFSLSFTLFSLDFSKVKTGNSKSSIIKLLGTPYKEIKNGNYEYLIWLDSKDIWLLLLEDEKVLSEPIMIDEILNTLLDLNNAISDFRNDNNSSTSDYSNSDNPANKQDKVDKHLLKSVDITILNCEIINKKYDPSAGYQFKVKNKGDKEITKLKIVLYFYDKNGKVFFETEDTLIDSDSYSSPKILKPNYSVLIPNSSSSYYTARGMDINEWDEGKVSYEIIELK